MNENTTPKLSALSLGALWFGAAVSMAEILTGGSLASLGWSAGTLANLGGHLLGGLIFFAAGWIAFRTNNTAMGTATAAFGEGGTVLFSLLNVLQLLGWTAVMVITGAASLNMIFVALWNWDNIMAARLILGGLLLLWTGLGFQGIRILNTSAVILLLGLTGVLVWMIFGAPGTSVPANPGAPPMKFSDGFELSLLMPLSWLPLVGDYTRRAKNGLKGNLLSSLGYFAGSCWMYFIGMAGTLRLGNPDPTQQILGAGLGLVGLVVILLSTVTTGFLDIYSAGLSFQKILPRIPEKTAALGLGTLGIVLSLVFPMDQYQSFLYILGSVFAPLFAVILIHYLVFSREAAATWAKGAAFISWGLGVFMYYFLQSLGTPFGLTFPTMVFTVVIYIIARKGIKLWKI